MARYSPFVLKVPLIPQHPSILFRGNMFRCCANLSYPFGYVGTCYSLFVDYSYVFLASFLSVVVGLNVGIGAND